MGVNNFNGGISFQFTLADHINNNDYIMITFPAGTIINYITSISPSFRITNMNYNSSNLTLMIYQQSSNPIYAAGTRLDLTFNRYRAPPSTKPTQPITFTILEFGHSKMIGSASITAVNNNYTLSTAVTSQIINEYTSFNLTFTMSDALTSSGYIVIHLDPLLSKTAPQIATITSNLSISIRGNSIRESPSTEISTVTVNGETAYSLKLSNLNTSSANIASQLLNITIRNLLNPNYVIPISYFRLFTYYSSENDLVGIGNYNGAITLQTGAIIFTNIATTSVTTYDIANITINFRNTNTIPNQGYLIVTIPAELTLLNGCISSLSFTSNGNSIPVSFTNFINNKSIVLQVGA